MEGRDKEPVLKWYTFFSWWIFIWFFLFKLNIISFSPFLMYIFVIIYITISILENLFNLTIKDLFNKNFNAVIFWLIIIILIDICPIFFLKPIINLESTSFTILLSIVYISMMNCLNINIINHYSSVNVKSIMKYYDGRKLLKNIIID